MRFPLIALEVVLRVAIGLFLDLKENYVSLVGYIKIKLAGKISNLPLCK
jgi:hypothetical protein